MSLTIVAIFQVKNTSALSESKIGLRHLSDSLFPANCQPSDEFLWWWNARRLLVGAIRSQMFLLIVSSKRLVNFTVLILLQIRSTPRCDLYHPIIALFYWLISLPASTCDVFSLCSRRFLRKNPQILYYLDHCRTISPYYITFHFNGRYNGYIISIIRKDLLAFCSALEIRLNWHRIVIFDAFRKLAPTTPCKSNNSLVAFRRRS